MALHRDGVLRGQLIDAEGAPQAGMPVAVVTEDGTAVASGRTDEAGRFEIHDVSAGTYLVGTQESGQVCRLWAPQTAPPAAQETVLLVEGEQVVRGAGARGLLQNPWFLAAAVAAAIAIPLAVSDDDDDGS